jgi:hypothetical protein
MFIGALVPKFTAIMDQEVPAHFGVSFCAGNQCAALDRAYFFHMVFTTLFTKLAKATLKIFTHTFHFQFLYVFF